MKGKWKRLFVLFMSFVLIVSFTACGQKQESTEKEKTPEEVEGTFSGVLQDALKDKIVVKSDEDIMEFKTVDSTVYELGDAEELTIGDTIDVDYRQDGADLIAETVTITKYRVVDLYFEGVVNDINGDDLTVTGAGMTAHFLKDKATKVSGNLSVGDEVKVIYTGDISEHPYATDIQITKEKEQPRYHTVKGTVSDLSDKTVLLSVHSSKAYRFKLTGKTQITGKDDVLKVGYEVELTYKGDIDKTPKATKVEVTELPTLKVKVIDGTVKSVQEKSFILDTGKKEYSFRIEDGTKFTGKKLKKGRIATVTYVGKLKKDPQAVAVYCIKPKKQKKKDEPIPDPKPQPKPDPKPQPKPTPVPDPTVTAYGEITGGDNDTVEITDEHGDVLELSIDGNTSIAAGYIPQVGDHVKIVYDKDKMYLEDIQLLYRPDPDKKQSEDDGTDDGSKTEDSSSADTGAGDSGSDGSADDGGDGSAE